MLQSKILSIPWVYRSSMMKSWIQPKWYASSASSFNSAVMVFLSTAKDKPLVYCTLLYVLAWPGPTFHAHSVASCCPCHFSNSCHVFHVWSVASCCLHHVSNKFELLLADKSYADATFHAHSVASCCPSHFSRICRAFHVCRVASCCLHQVSNKFQLLLADKSYADGHSRRGHVFA